MNLIKGTRLIAAVSLVAGLAACGDDDKNTGDTTDTSTDTVTDTTTDTTTSPDTTPDTTTSPDTSPDTTTAPDTTPTETVEDTTPETEVVEPTCTENGFTGEAFMEYDDVNNYINFGLSNDAADLLIEFYDLGNGNPLTGPGDYPLGANEADQNYATCETCALIFTEDTIYFATSGVITVTEVDEAALTVRATLNDATLVEVTIDQTTFESTPVAGGGAWCIEEAAIEYVPECTTDADCGGEQPFCETESRTCAGCLSSLDCTAENPLCGVDDAGEIACIEGITVCTGDDANENHDDGPLGANEVTLDTPVDAMICGEDGAESGAEFDWYTFTLAAETNLEITLTFAAELDIDFFFVNEQLETVESGGATEAVPEVVRAVNVPAGKYYIAVNSYAGAPVASVAYNLSVATFTPECTESADCTADPAKPACDLDSLTCVACVSDFDCTAETPVCQTDDAGVAACGIVDECTGDDEREHGDDGPAGATVVTLPSEPIVGKICGASDAPSGAESDFYKVTIPADGSLTANLAWEGADIDLDMYVLDATGAIVDDAATTANPEEVTVSNPGAGDYYLFVYSYDGAPTDAIDYTLTLTLATP